MPSRTDRQKKFSKKKKWTLIISSILVAFLLAIGGYVYAIYHKVEQTANVMHEPIDRKKSEKRVEQVEVQKKEPLSILLLGVDERKGDKGRSDTIIVITVNPEKKSMKMVSIPRDTRTEIIGHGTVDKINHAYAFGGVEMSMNTVESFLNIPIDYYIKVNMEGFQKIVDAVGGVTVNNPFAFTSGGDTFTKGTISLTGKQALSYARMRHEDPRGDFGRQDRQKEIIKAVIDKGASFSTLTNYGNILGAIGESVKTNLTFDEMKDIQKNYKDATNQIEQIYITGEGTRIDNIYYLLVPDEKKLEISNSLREELGVNK